MNRRFRLAAVERLRGNELDAAGQALHAANVALLAGLERRDHAMARLAAAASDRAVTGADVPHLGAHHDRLREEVVVAATEVDRLDGELSQARDGWLQARARLKAVEALHERHRAAVREEARRQEQRELDERAVPAGGRSAR